MSVTIVKILDAAEARIRQSGYNGFSFRDIAEDVGIKSASIHYHFPTKADLGAAVAQRYTERFLRALDVLEEVGTPALKAWREVFRTTLIRDKAMCLCGVMAAEQSALPDAVADEAKLFFEAGIDRLKRSIGGRGAKARAIRVFAMLEGAMLMARSLEDPKIFDQATASLEDLLTA